MPQKVFLCHATEDKARFVEGLATQLRASGVDAWYDKWEMSPGDSLVKKIFDEGLKGTDTVIVVLSRISINKPWVKEELATAIIKRIEEGIKIIPIKIDDCSIPESLKSTLWVKIENIDSYKDELASIIKSIHDIKNKPPLGEMPDYVNSVVENIPDLSTLDNLVLKLSCEYAIKNNKSHLARSELFNSSDYPDISEPELLESLEILEINRYIELFHTLGNKCDSYKISTFGLDEYANAYIPNYKEVKDNLISLLVNEDIKNSEELLERLDAPIIIIKNILDLLEENGLIKSNNILGGSISIHHISPVLKRSLQ